METNFEAQCPFCFENIWLEFYPEDGEDQEMIIDCEVCCHPIQYHVVFNRDGSSRLDVSPA